MLCCWFLELGHDWKKVEIFILGKNNDLDQCVHSSPQTLNKVFIFDGHLPIKLKWEISTVP